MSNIHKVDFLIIGGGIAGTTAAETIRGRSNGSIMIVTDDLNPLYSRVRLPDYVADKISREKVFIKGESWYHEKELYLLRQTSVTSLSPNERFAHLSNGTTIQYQQLLIATGGVVRRLSCEGSQLDGIHYLRTIEDAGSIKRAMQMANKAVVIGGGFIGLELARCFRQKGLETVIIMLESQFWPSVFDYESGKMIEDTMSQQGVTVHYNDHVKEFKGNGKVQSVNLASGKSYACDIAGIGIGILTSYPFIKALGIQTRQGILTDEYLQTSNPHIFAAGDVVEFYDVCRTQHNQLGNWSNASEQGKVAALNMLGEKTVYRSVSSYVIRVFDLSIGFVGDTAVLPNTQVICRGSARSMGYMRLFLRDGVIKGATLLNQIHEMRKVTELIKRTVKIEKHRLDLSDLNHDLESFLI